MLAILLEAIALYLFIGLFELQLLRLLISALTPMSVPESAHAIK